MPESSHNLPDNSIVCLMAPTASGKTALAYELYDTGRYELISVDSALIYRGMNIGTAKPNTAELARYPHHLVDIIDPTQSYSVAEFVKEVEQLINDCHQRAKIPLLVGGTMMYYMALIEGLSPVPDSDETVRAQVELWRQNEGIGSLYDYLAKVDPVTHKRLQPADTQRITRAVEVYKQTNSALSDWQRQPKHALANNLNQQWYVLSVLPERVWLHERIGRRLDIMWEEGLVAEVISLLERYTLNPDMPAMRCVGYRQVLEYLVQIQHPIFDQSHLNKSWFYKTFTSDKVMEAIDTKTGNSSLSINSSKLLNEAKASQESLACDVMRNKALYATRQLAKRQYTWLRKLSKTPESMQQLQNNTIKNLDINATSLTDEQHNIVRKSFTTLSEVRDYLL